jgi:hypothetical protein
MDAVVSVISLVVSIIAAYLVARKYGDVAGTLAARRFQEEDAARARVTALQSLMNEIERIRRVMEHYDLSGARAESRGVPKMPVAAFETAFISGRPGLAASKELVDTVCDYLVLADSVNSLIELYSPTFGMAGRINFPEICAACAPTPGILDRLEDCLQRELEEARRRLG